MKAVKVTFSTELMRQMLFLPDDCEIIGSMTKATEHGDITLVIQSQQFKEVECRNIPQACPTFEKCSEGMHMAKLVNWGIQD